MTYDADALHGFAHDSIARGSKSFALASQLFDRLTRERVWLLYAWCRAADDLTDGQDHGGAMTQDHDPKAAVARIRTLTDAAFAGQPTGDLAGDAVFARIDDSLNLSGLRTPCEPQANAHHGHE